MSTWKYEVRVKDLLLDDNDQTLATPLGKAIAKRLEGLSTIFEDDCELENIINILDSINTIEQWFSLCMENPSWHDYPPIQELNDTLSSFYNWCDANRVLVR